MPELETAEGTTIHFYDRGGGAPLVFLHGWGMSAEVWSCQRTFAERYRIIVPDLRGHGRSSAPPSGYSFECFARDLAELFAHLGLERAIVVAWSMGVQVVLQAFPLIRERLAALVFVSGTAKFTAAENYSCGLPPAASRNLGIRLKKDHARAARDFIRGMFTEEERRLECCERMSAIADGHRLPAPHAARESLESLAASDFRGVLPGINLPVLLVHGSADAICPVTAAYVLEKLLPDARLTVMAGAGHAPFLSRPEEFTAILSAFIDGIHGEN